MSSNAVFKIKDAETMLKFGKIISQIFLEQTYRGSVLFYGALGSGKTTFTRGFVANLPNGDQAETASPSFTLCNNYPTDPPTLHCDLYRRPEIRPAEVDELFDDFPGIILIEWAEHLPDSRRPKEYLAFHFYIVDSYRKVSCSFSGTKEQEVFQSIKRQEQTMRQALTTSAK